ncbi:MULTISPECIES: RNA polymerase sigma factor [Bacillales]|uniref:RNA polymerase sigma factor n=1 Tax=Bacillales TaxID=1385 RepID=UPI00034B8934|nr:MULTISPECIES: RNA polymerase sigma factor [Bacillales]KMZ43586.1 RNA polymerase sigma-70 factor [Bacillus sp. FJAT-27238]
MQDIEQEILSIHKQYHLDIYQFLLYFTGNHTEAEDLTQEVFIRLLKALPTYDGCSEMKTWIFSIAKYTAIDAYRRRKMYELLPSEWLKRLHSKDGIPECSWESKETQHELMNAIRTLKPAYRMAVYLRGIKEFSIKETAGILGCTESKVKTDFSRGLQILQQKLKPHYYPGGLQTENVK